MQYNTVKNIKYSLWIGGWEIDVILTFLKTSILNPGILIDFSVLL